MSRSFVLIVALVGCETQVVVPEVRPAAAPSPVRAEGVEVLRVDPAARARWSAVHAPGLEGTARPPAAPSDEEQRLRAAAHAAGEIPMRAGELR